MLRKHAKRTFKNEKKRVNVEVELYLRCEKQCCNEQKNE